MEATNYSDFRRNLKHYMSQVNEDADRYWLPLKMMMTMWWL